MSSRTSLSIPLYLPHPVRSGVDGRARVSGGGKRENSEGDVQRF